MEPKPINVVGNTSQGKLLRGYSSDSTRAWVHRAVASHDREAIRKIIEDDSNNIRVLIGMSATGGVFDRHESSSSDGYSFKEILDDVLRDPKYRYWSMIAHFQYFFDAGEKGLRFLLKDYADESSAWFPIYMDTYQEFLLWPRHLLKTASKSKEGIPGRLLRQLAFFLDLRYNDVSVVEIAGSRLDSASYAQLKTGNLRDVINIPNSELFIRTSSQLSKQYCAQRMLDYDLGTVWAEGTSGDGSGEWIRIQLRHPQFVKNIILFPGHSGGRDLFLANNRMKRIKVMANGVQKTVDIGDTFAPVSIALEQQTSEIKLQVLSVYRGSKFNDLCVGEVMLTRK